MTNLIERQKLNKRIFNIHDGEDINEFEYFMVNKRWKTTCPFHVNWPYVNVVDMIKDQIVQQYIDNEKSKNKIYSFTELEKAMR